MRENNCCPAKLHRDLGSVAILFGCSVFLLHKSAKLDVFGVVGSRRNFYSKHRKRVPFSVFLPARSVRNCLLGSVPNPL